MKIGLLSLWVLFSFSNAHGFSSPWREYSHSQAQLISSHNSVGQDPEVYVGLWLKLRPHWHTYWENPGDSGAPPILKWELPPGAKISGILWPTPERILTSGLYTFGYSGEVFILQKLTLPKALAAAQVTLKLEAEWLVCNEICVPQRDQFELVLPLGKNELDPKMWPLIEESLSRVPQEKTNFIFSWKEAKVDGKAVYALKVTAPDGIDFKPDDLFAGLNIPVKSQPPKMEKKNASEWLLTFDKINLSTAITDRFIGLLKYKENDKPNAIRVNVPIAVSSLWVFIFSAFLGGLILNLMPCVLPIIMLKAFSILKNSQASLAQIRRESFLYTLGVVLSLWILALTIFAMQSAGRLVGWGFQLQSPLFNIFLILIFTVMGFNLMGLFDLQLAVPRRFQSWLSWDGDRGAIATGFLSVLVASPCTAPFMGVAIGFALSQTLFVILVIFTSLGLGLAFPYLLIAFFPSLARYLPRPGAWMNTFKKVLAIPMWLTAIWLAWVLVQQTGLTKNKTEHTLENGLRWENFSEEKIAALRNKQALFIDFTADWCLACKVNERLVFGDSTVLNELKRKDLVLLKADWTNYDPLITQWLKNYQRAGVPFYILIYADGREEILPEVLTANIFLKSIERVNNKEIKK